MATKTMIRIKKDYYRKGYYSVHECRYKNGKMVSETLIDYTKKKKDADAIKRNYIKYRK